MRQLAPAGAAARDCWRAGRDLSVARNQLRALPPQIGRCRSLQRIDASNNRLESLPPKLGQCRDLRELDVHRNNLTALPAALGRLPLLSRLLFERNAVEHFPPELAHCERLEEINCFDNPIRNLPAQCLTDVGMIRWLAEHDYSWQERVKALEESSAELEDAARQSSEQRMLLQERVEMLEGELRLLEESTERYRTVRRACATWCPECSGCTIV